MRRALELGWLAAGSTSPNPAVGCVVLDRAGAVVGEGHTQPAGQPHAEIVAVRAAAARARDGTAVVTLEPCGHTGRTGPCVAALQAAGVVRVVYAVRDPNPLAAGGADQLAAAGLSVEGEVLGSEAARGALEPWLFAVRHGRPYVTWKYAATLDGRVAAADGTSRWVTGPAARAEVHQLRSQVDAIVVGVGTVLTDDPQLTVRDGAGVPAVRQPLRVVLDCSARTPAGARVLDSSAPTLVFTGSGGAGHRRAEAGREPRHELLAVPADVRGRGVDLSFVLDELYRRGVRHVLVEGGPTVAGSFVRAGYVDRVVGYLAPALLGAGPAALGAAGVDTLAGAVRLHLDEVARVGPDLRVVARPRTDQPAGEG